MAPGRGDKIRSSHEWTQAQSSPVSTAVQNAETQTATDGPLWDRIWATWQSSALPQANDGQGGLLEISRSQPPPPAPLSKRISVVEKARAWTETKTDSMLKELLPNVSDHVEVDPRFEKR